MDIPAWWESVVAQYGAAVTVRQIARSPRLRATVSFPAPVAIQEAQGLAGALCRDGLWRYERMAWEDGPAGLVVSQLRLVSNA